ncbi:acetyltransferase [Marinomonas atlantica]|uniref:acetyltransferase n=1 Tax=Marinomonas atlantica TaxID=1806668 RepID=UPI000A6DB002|nr:acetyltransferase [Marinomonas atlantica]
MLTKLLPWAFTRPLIGLLSFIFLCLNILLWGVIIHFIALLQILLNGPSERSKVACENCYRAWVKGCEWWFRYMLGMHWKLDQQLIKRPDTWHLVIANHRSWVDAFVVLMQVQGRMPMPRIFMKDSLAWLPLVGSATKIMGFPQVKRYSKANIAKHPDLALHDVRATEEACQPLKSQPSTIMTFAEGTRFSARKHRQQASPYKHLLCPKAGGIFRVLKTMPGCFHEVTDLNIVYGDDRNSFWYLLCGQVSTVQVKARSVRLPDSFKNMNDQVEKQAFYDWFNQYWTDKDRSMSTDVLHWSNVEIQENGSTKKGNGLQNY